MILGVGYRMRCPRGAQFRQWSNAHLEEYLRKGFVMDDERLKVLGCWNSTNAPSSKAQAASAAAKGRLATPHNPAILFQSITGA